MYLYHIPDEIIGQRIDPNGYLYVDEENKNYKKRSAPRRGKRGIFGNVDGAAHEIPLWTDDRLISIQVFYIYSPIASNARKRCNVEQRLGDKS